MNRLAYGSCLNLLGVSRGRIKRIRLVEIRVGVGSVSGVGILFKHDSLCLLSETEKLLESNHDFRKNGEIFGKHRWCYNNTIDFLK